MANLFERLAHGRPPQIEGVIKPPCRREDPKIFLKDILAAGPAPANLVIERGAERGFTKRQITYAREQMKLIALKGPGMDGCWFWTLPHDNRESRRSRQHLGPGTGQVAGAPRKQRPHKTTVRQPNPSNNGRMARSVQGGIETPLSGRAKPRLPGIRLYRIWLHPSRARSDDLQSPMFNFATRHIGRAVANPV